ncbi:hypothetical protein OS493_019945 [Desmophyllum pertusum]|uniref:Uncharacterized protein n=1 Tax=Desmophyllum pertusum TaxID=174260 RepID=A0A9X0CJQ1_9CNID|nr:hypothetical protein OS493_019945 [Desmophyllum pertusum]
MVIDEASMKRPVVLIAGDKVQQQPLGNHHGRVVQLASILNDGHLDRQLRNLQTLTVSSGV